MTKQIAISNALHSRLKRYAAQHGKKLGAIAEQALKRYLHDERKSNSNQAGLELSGPAVATR